MFNKFRFRTENTIYYLVAIYACSVIARAFNGPYSLIFMSGFLCCLAVLVWVVAIRDRFIVPDIRRLFYAIAILLLFLHFVQLLKYSIFGDNVTIRRYCWYAYYIPLTLIPYLSLVISLKVDRPVKRMSPFVHFSGVFTVVQIILLMTNDLNGLTFRFKDGDLTNLNDYSRGVLFFINIAWGYLMMAASYFICLTKSYKRIKKKYLIAAVAFTVIFFALYIIFFVNPSDNLKIFGILFLTVPMLFNMVFVLFWEMCIRFGIIPANIDYEYIFNISGIAAQLCDHDKKTALRSEKARPLPEEVRKTTDEVINIGNSKYNSRKISGGFVYWEEDVSKINAINSELRETGERLSDENALLMEEATIKKESAKFNEVNRIYDDIASSLKGKLKNIEKIINEAENTDSPTLKKDLLRACVMGAYLKRYSNMTLLSKTTEVGSNLIPAGELQLAIRESLEYLCLGGGKLAKVFLSCEGERLKVSTALKLYEIFECFVEELVMSDCTLMADINKDASGNIILKLNVGIDDGDDKEAFTEACARIKVEYGMSVEFGDEDSDQVYITISGRGSDA